MLLPEQAPCIARMSESGKDNKSSFKRKRRMIVCWGMKKNGG
jgi:hypothetical protein